jgi:hypothetical protein
MRKTINIFYWFLFIIIALCILNLSVMVKAQGKNSLEDQSELKATVNMQVSWNKHDEYDSNLEETGSMSVMITGILTQDKQRKGVFLFFPGSQGMQARVKYQNVTKDKKNGELHMTEEGSGSVTVLSPRSVTNPQTQGHFEFMAFTGPGGRALALQLAGQVDPIVVMKAMAGKENMDHYNFSVIAPIETTVIDKDGNSNTGLRGIHFALIAEKLKSGTISNSLSWRAKKIKYSIEHQSFMGTVYEPPKAEEGDVDYSVTWTFADVPPAVDIQQKVNDKWVDITDETVQVVVGEKVKIRGVVMPEDKDPKEGTWTIEGGGNAPNGADKNYIKRYDADFHKGKVVQLQDLSTQELEFYWVDGGTSKVKYVTRPDGQDVSAEANFEIRKPNYELTVEASKETEIKNPERGGELPSDECWGKGAHGIVEPNDLVLQYMGIRFEAENLDQGEISGEVQWVQIIEKQSYFRTYENSIRITEEIVEALDLCYPTQSGSRAKDAPGIVLQKKGKNITEKTTNGITELVYTGKTQKNRMYLMFKPDGDASEWVPIKVVNWTWIGNAEYQSDKKEINNDIWNNGWRTRDCEIDPLEPKAEDTSEYPIWDKNSGDNSKYTIK